MASQIYPLCNGATSRARVFHLQGVTLQFLARSRSGVRDYDGVVVFAMGESEVRMDDWGFSCLLWAPARRRSGDAIDQASELERLQHCRLALRCGIAEGFVLYGEEAMLGREGMLSLRVMKAGGEYWARWGHTARARSQLQHAASGART